MSKRNLADLAYIALPEPYNDPPMESQSDSEKEDKRRVLVSNRALAKLPAHLNGVRKPAERLIKRLRGLVAPESMASSRFYRHCYRGPIAGHIWKLCVETAFRPVGTATILVDGWQFAPEDLHLVDPKQLLRRFRSALEDCGLSKFRGFAVFSLHGEFNATTDLFDLHIHGVFAGNLRPVMHKLRKRPMYRSFEEEHEGLSLRVHRVKVSRKPLINLPNPLTYVFQSWWPMKELYVKDGKLKRRRLRGRIPDVPHLLWMLWMDRWRIADLTMLVGLRVTKAGLMATRQP